MEKSRFLENRSINHILDVDEVVFNSLERHVKWLNSYGQKLGWTDLPSYEEVCLAGGTHGAYSKYGESYWELNRKMRNSPKFNIGQVLIDGAKEALLILAPTLPFYLTTRPESLAQLTRQEIIKAGLPDREVIARPKSIALEETSKWKFSKLEEYASKLKKQLVMIDDSTQMHDTIVQANRNDISSILFDGPFTPVHPKAKNWKQILEDVTKNYSEV